MQASTTNCKNCGAPPAKLMATECAYCGTPLLVPAKNEVRPMSAAWYMPNAPKADVKKKPESKNSLLFGILAVVLGFGLIYWWVTALNKGRHDE